MENEIVKKPNEIRIDRAITEKDILKFNEIAPLVITLTNTKDQNPNILAKLSEGITIRILGGFNENVSKEYAHNRYLSKTTYTPGEVCGIIDYLNQIESQMDPDWTDLEKATYGYLVLMSSLKPKREKFDEKQEEINPLNQIFTAEADSYGYAILYKELLDRLDISCKFLEKKDEHAWNEVLIDGIYYPADLFFDASINEKTLSAGQGFELKNFLSDKEFYYLPDHQTGKEKEQTINALDHSEIQKAIDKVLHPERQFQKESPKVSLKSKELQKIFEKDIVTDQDFEKIETIKIDFTSQNVEELREDLLEIGKSYPRALDNMVLANNTGTHINIQEVIDAIFEGRKDENGTVSKKSELVIESNLEEDFNLDFSNAPEVVIDELQKAEDISHSQKLTLVSTATTPINIASLSGKIPYDVDTIRIENCNTSGFDIRYTDLSRPRIGPLRNVRRLELFGNGISGIRDIRGLDEIISLNINDIPDTEFEDVMDISIRDSITMPKLYELIIENQHLASRDFLNEITNQNIISLMIENSELNNIDGIDSIKDRLIKLELWGNNLSVDQLKRINKCIREYPIIRSAMYSPEVYNKINTLGTTPISDETFNYLDSLYRRSGYIEYRNMIYYTYSSIEEQKKMMLFEFSRWDLDKVPYFIEDARVFREILPYINNPMMVKDLTTFENYLNDPSNYFEQPHLKDGKLWLTKEQLDYLISSGKTIPQETYLKINTVTELNRTELANYESECRRLGINLNGIIVFDDRCIDSIDSTLHHFDENDTHLAPYKIDEFDKIREKLEEVVKDIVPSMSDAEKFAVVYYRLATLIDTYDTSAHGDTLSKEHAIYQAEKCNTARNLSEGLIKQKGFDLETNSVDNEEKYRCVCAGYADILKNALDMVGVESLIECGCARRAVISGELSGGHEWNKVKINGNWYYADLCWDAGRGRYINALRGIDNFVSGTVSNINGVDVEEYGHFTYIKPGERNEVVGNTDYNQTSLESLFNKVRSGELPPKRAIIIEDHPELNFDFNIDIDIENIRQEYKDRKNDMIAKFYGDREYQRKYEEIAERYRANEIEVTSGGITYKTVRDYAEREEDEKFLILGEYKTSLERMTKYDAGDVSVYTGTPDEIRAAYEKDKEYVETRNYTFDQHKNTQKDLGTLGKYGQTLPYIPRQTGLVRNVLIGTANVGIFARNLVAPAYRFVGRFVAQPLHRLITGGRDASPYRNNPYHRFVARRDYFRDMANQENPSNGIINSLIKSVASNVNAIARYREGNDAVLKAGAYDIQANLRDKEVQRLEIDFYTQKKAELESQIAALEASIIANPYAINITESKNKLAEKQRLLGLVEKNIERANNSEKVIDIQTDAVSQKQHDIASQEVNTYRVVAIKGVAKYGFRRFVGPKIQSWLLENKEKTINVEETYQDTIFVEKEIKEPSKIVSITEERPDYDIEVDELIERSKDRTVNMYRSVSGGNLGQVDYTIKGNEVCTGFHFQDGTKWGTGFSGNAPLMTDKFWPESFLNASNKLRDDITFSEIAEAISNGELNEEMLSNMTFQIGNKGWVYADELFEGITKDVEVGTKIIEGTTKIELVPELVDRTRTISKVIENQRVVNALNVINNTRGIRNTISNIDTVHNAAEILRTTQSTTKDNKPKTREYTYDDSEFYS